MSDSEMSDEEISDEEISDEEISDEEMTDEEMTDEEISDEEISDEEAEEKQVFTIRHTFEKPLEMKKDDVISGNVENHFGIPWLVFSSIFRIKLDLENTGDDELTINLNCLKPDCASGWIINTCVIVSLINATEKKKLDARDVGFTHLEPWDPLCDVGKYIVKKNLIDGNLVVEVTVSIGEQKTFKHLLRSFTSAEAVEKSDVTLVAKGVKFHVVKMYLATHGEYFKSMFSGKFSEKKKEEIELKDVDPYHLQCFLELIYGELPINDHNISGLFALVDMFIAKSARRRCIKYLEKAKKLSLGDKLELSFEYRLEDLKVYLKSHVFINYLNHQKTAQRQFTIHIFVSRIQGFVEQRKKARKKRSSTSHIIFSKVMDQLVNERKPGTSMRFNAYPG
ncbi:hypothetical protein CRE_21415 [Caenorhabditis remanei]|uniref:BTB domain-containing protein n=1 Tax=Caenorhabditis remanei TaxID=31234 RepID=E3MUT7_CAERE|nr:hypothetical protein CRE_21415 [Caenorhabditis remanei]